MKRIWIAILLSNGRDGRFIVKLIKFYTKRAGQEYPNPASIMNNKKAINFIDKSETTIGYKRWAVTATQSSTTTVINALMVFVVLCSLGYLGQNKRIAPLPFFHGCRKR
jgi:hypothetical protein